MAVRYVALFVLVVALLLIFVRWRFPRANERVRRRTHSRPRFWHEFWQGYRASRARQRERRDDIRAVRGKSILVVDPDEKSAKVLIWKLEQLGCKVTKTRTGRQAISLVQSEQLGPVEGRSGSIDIVISDALLPDISAADFCEALKLSGLPVVLVGVLRDQRDGLSSFENLSYIGKPYDPEDAAALAGRMLRNLTFQPRQL